MAAVLGVDPDPLHVFEVRHHPTGAPAPHAHDAAAPLSVSMTDRADWAVTVAHSHAGHRLGCDLELVESRSEAFVRDWFTPPERDRVLAVSGEERDLLANLVWSAKESGLKVLQTGLRRDTRSVEVVLHDETDAGWNRLEVVAVEGTRMPGWWRRLGHFVLTVAADVELPPPEPLHTGAHRIGDAVPRHTWVDDPLT
jgi:4'-phosphopantetheinyl transferase